LTALRQKPLAEHVEAANADTFHLTPAQDKARDVLISDALHVALGGGARSGKTFLLLRAVIIRALKADESRHAIFRYTFNSIKASIVYDTLPKVMKLCFPGMWNPKSLNKTDWFYTLPNGSELWFGGLDDKERTEKILGQEYATIYFNECSQIPWNSVQIALTRLAQQTKELKLKAYYDFNPPSKKHWTYMRFVEKRDPITKQPEANPFNFGFYLINPGDNTENLAPEYLELLNSLPEKQRNRFLLGKFADDDEGALWTEELLAQNRRLGQAGSVPEFVRIIIAVDPSGCSGPEDLRSDEIGIVVCALGTDMHGYLLEDLSGRYGPEEWGVIVAESYKRLKADCVIGEANFGGDMVRAIIHAQNPNIPYKEVHASRGKIVRAEPISSLYEQAKIHHIGYFPELEDQLCSMTLAGYVGLKSPDRGDAVVWGWTELFPEMTRKVDPNVSTPKVITRGRNASRFDGHRNTDSNSRQRRVRY
jgi:phage terminase large subunit-like protein